MKFVDEAKISVEAGKGGDGCLSFRREKYLPRGGPDGGDGGHGGSVVLTASGSLNTLVDFRHKRRYRANNGESGRGKEQTGKTGDDLKIEVPAGTVVWEEDTGECIGELVAAGDELVVAQGGVRGIGNTRFKSSVNRAPRQTTKGKPGETRNLRLELKLLAEVGLLGLPNAGKSSLLRALSAAQPKVADYPFTTLHPTLGVVNPDPLRSFVMADIPGIIEGAAEGAGLGHRFLRHLGRTRLLLHLIDIATPTEDDALIGEARAIVAELERYDSDLAARPRWLVLNKIDLMDEQEAAERAQFVKSELHWDGPLFCLSAKSRDGCLALSRAVMDWIESVREHQSTDEVNAADSDGGDAVDELTAHNTDNDSLHADGHGP
tara:strand:+ start:97 stop:1227 length:1131 start_codon:yes stop_codon:yes gene_type:complete